MGATGSTPQEGHGGAGGPPLLNRVESIITASATSELRPLSKSQAFWHGGGGPDAKSQKRWKITSAMLKVAFIVTVAANELRGRGTYIAGELKGGIHDATGREADPDA